MKAYCCISDIGSVLVGNETVRFALPNIGGDGETILTIYDKTESVPANARFVTCIEGTFNVFNYDCSKGNPEDVIETLEGRYGVWQADYAVILQKWD